MRFTLTLKYIQETLAITTNWNEIKFKTLSNDRCHYMITIGLVDFIVVSIKESFFVTS